MKLNRITEEDFSQMVSRVKGGMKGKSSCQSGQARASISSSDKTKVQHAAPSPIFPLTIAVTGQMISGKNRVRIRRDGHHYPEKQFINWRAKSYLEVLEQTEHKQVTINTPVMLKCWYWPSDERTRDVTGMLDALFYLLVYAGVLKNDGLIYDCYWYRYPRTKYPKVVMEITPWL